MQLKATKLAAILSRLHFARLALFAAFGLCAAAPQTAQGDQWFRFTITGRANYKGDLHDYIQLDEFALVDESGTVVSRGLQQDTSGSELPAADKFKYSGPYAADSQVNLFTQGNLKYCVPKITSVNPLDENQRPIFTIHLGPSVAPVAGYNLRSGNDTGDYNGACYGRAPVAWTIETSLDGGATWVVIDTKTVSNDAGLTSNNTWYDGGGSSNDGPTTFYPFSSLGFLRRLAADERRVAVDDDPYATGGDIVLKAGDDYIHVFYDTSAAKTFTVNKSCSAEILAVGGGGSGGGDCGGGGGAGGLVYKENVLLTPNDYTVTVGAGGAGPTEKIRGNTGSNTSFKLGDANVIDVALGGGGGGMYNDGNGASGGSGGGACNLGGTVGVGSNGQGNNGGKGAGSDYGGGGGGAGAAGSDSDGANGGSGGDGLEYGLRFFGWQQYFAGGGGGGNAQDSNDSVGGLGGGGKGGCKTASTFSAGENGLGAGGGGGGGGSNKGGGAGGSGIVIIRCSPRAAQWFRLTITERWGRSDEQTGTCWDGYFQLGEFALFDELGNQVNKNLTMGTSATELSAGQYHCSVDFEAGKNADKVFDGVFATKDDKWGCDLKHTLRTVNPPIVFTMRLAEDAATVAKYNLATGDDNHYRHPSAWKLESSSDGVNWVTVDEQRIDDEQWVVDAQWFSKGNSALSAWYAGGGKGEKPTKFYALQPQELPLPAGFTRLEWIKSTRQQRILTDYYPNPKTWMQVDCMFTNVFQYSGHDLSDPKEQYFFGTIREDSRPRYNMAFGGIDGQSEWIWFYPDSTGFRLNFTSVGENAIRSQLTVSNGVEKAVVEWTGGITYTDSAPSKKQQVCQDPLVLFGCGDKNFGSYDMTVWSWKIYESDSGSGVNDPSSHLVHNFIPALSPTGVPGLFDSITGEFLSSATATPFAYQKADQWFRFTMKRKWGGATTAGNRLELDELALYTAENVNVATGLLKSTASATAIPAGMFVVNSMNYGVDSTWPAERVFDGSHGDDDKVNFCNNVDTDVVDCCYTIHLSADAGEVVKYNLMTGGSLPYHKNRTPIAWTMERSYDGVNWELVDERTDEKSNGGCPQTAFTWYNNGGTYNTSTGANAVPSNFYWFAELPLPELLQSEYDYVGYKLVPAVKGAEGLIASGTTAATNAGTYKIVYSLPAGAKWVGGSTAPYEIEWSIVSPRPKFLERLAADPRRVDDTPSVYSAYATGGDLILKDEDLGVFIHVFTNTTGTAQFHANQALDNASVLVVAGGGQGGPTYKGCSGGGGAGGVIYQEGCVLSGNADYAVKVGVGGENKDPGSFHDVRVKSLNGGDSQFGSYTAIGGGAGAGNAWGGNNGTAIGSDGGSGGGAQYHSQTSKPVSGGKGTEGQGFAGGSITVVIANNNRGSGGGGAGGPGADISSKSDVSTGGPGRKLSILGFDQCFGGGGAGYQEGSVTAMGGVGGGGCVFEGQYMGQSGENGLGGGAAGVNGVEAQNPSIPAGGDGIVIVRYSYNANANVKVAKPTAKAGLLYNGCTQLAVEEGEGYVLSGRVSADNAGSYTATATLLAGYEWADGSTSALTLSWRIDPAPITGVQLSANEAQYTGSSVAQPTVVAVTTANGLTITDANCGWELPVRYERDRQETTDFTRLGYISVVVTGKGNLTGTKAATFRIYDPKKIPLPKPVQVYEYTGNPITPTFEPTGGYTIAPKGYTPTSGNYAATECGVYTVTCTLENGKTWENGSTGPYEVTWEIVKKQTFLEKLASDPRRVNGEGVTDFDTGLAQGGDLVLFDPEASAFIHVFTNTAEAAIFTARQNLNAWVLAVGGGGSGGNNDGGGGGAGGMIEDKNLPFVQEQSVSITIGAGAPGVASGHGFTGSQTQINIPGLDSIIAYGGGGGGCVDWHIVSDQNPAKGDLIDGYGGENVGSGGGASGYYYNTWDPSGSGVPGRSITMYKGVKQGNDGGAANSNRSCPAGGGGGAGAAGETPDSYDQHPGRHGSGQNIGGYGGIGRSSDILGISQYFAGGGGSGGNHAGSGIALGGEGGGGNGAGYSTAAVSSSVPVAQSGENGLGGGGGGGKGGDAHADYKYGAPGGNGIVIIRYMATPPIEVPVPTAKTGLFYNGNTQVGVPESFAYTLADYYATTAGTYTATATLNHGYRWADSTGDNDLTRTVEWTILNYMRLEALDNGDSLDKAGYVALTNFHLTGTNVVELKYQFNTDATHWQNIFMTRDMLNGVRTEYGLVRAEGAEKKLQVSYNVIDQHNNASNLETRGRDEQVVRLCPTNDTSNGLVGYCNGSAITWEIQDRSYTMFEAEIPHDLFLFTAENPNKLDGKPAVDGNGKLTSAALAKMYYFRVENSATDPTPRLDLVPVQDTTTKARGFYDLVNGNFYPLKTPVVLDGNGGEPAKQYVYTSNGDSMPALPNGTPTRAGFEFTGYAMNGWEVKPMTGKETDFIDEGTSIWAYRAYNGSGARTVVNGTEFLHGLLLGTNQGPDATRQTDPVFTTDIGFDGFSEITVGGEFTGCTQDYTCVVSKRIEFQDRYDPRHDRVTFTLRKGLVAGKSYAVQIISYHKADDSQPTNRLGFSENTYYENCAPVNPMGVSFVYRFEATNTTHSFTLYKPTEVRKGIAVFLSISAIQLREIGEDASVMDKYLAQYYDEKGNPVKACDFGEGTTLYAQWEPGKYRVIDPENGPKIAVDPEWLNGAFGPSADYQAKLFTTNASCVVAWQAYVLGFGASEVSSAAIVEETAQNADPDTVTIRLRGMPEKPRTNETSRLAYSLYAASTSGGLANGGGTVVTNLDEEAYYKWPKSTFEAPLKDLTDAEPVNYYRIKVHFIFNKSE